MAPVDRLGVDRPVSEVGQVMATGLTFALAAVAVLYVVSRSGAGKASRGRSSCCSPAGSPP